MHGEGMFHRSSLSILISPSWVEAAVLSVLCLHKLLCCIHVHRDHGKRLQFELVSWSPSPHPLDPPLLHVCTILSETAVTVNEAIVHEYSNPNSPNSINAQRRIILLS